MTDQPKAIGSRAQLVLLVALLLGCALVSRMCFLLRPFDSDGAMFIYMGRLVSEGGRIGADLVDNKFPTVGLVTSAAWRAFGANWTGYVLLGTALSLAGALVLGRAASRSLHPTAFWPTTLFALVYLNFNSAVFGGFQLESMQVFFTAIAGAAALEALTRRDARDAFVVGLCVGTAAMLKPTGLAVLGAFVLSVLLSRRQVVRLLSGAMLGLAIPVAISLVYLTISGALADLPTIARQISRYSAESAWNAQDLLKPLFVLLIAGFPLLVRGWVFRRDAIAHSTSKPLMGFIILWALLELAGTILQHRMYAYHFLVLAPPLSLLFGAIARQLRVPALTAALTPVAIFSLVCAAEVIRNPWVGGRDPDVVAFLRTHALPGDRVWQDDTAAVLVQTGLRPGSRHTLTFLFANYDTAPLEYSQRIIDDFRARQPRFVVLRTDLDRYVELQRQCILELSEHPIRSANHKRGWDAIGKYVAANYHAVARTDRDTIWERRAQSGDAAAADLRD